MREQLASPPTDAPDQSTSPEYQAYVHAPFMTAALLIASHET
jgi:hypothetical protein